MKFKIRNLFKNKDKENKRTGDVNVRYVGAKQNKYTAVYDEEKALTNSVIYRGVSILTDSVASIPLGIYRKDKKGFWKADEKNTLYNVLTRTPNNRQTIYELLEGLVFQLIMFGNAYILIKRNASSDVKELVLLYPHSVYHDVISNTYNVTDTYNGVSGLFNSNQIIHLRHKSLENIVGKSVVDYCAKTLGLASACDSESLSTLSNGNKMKGIISSESSVIGFGDAQDSQLVDIQTNIQNEIDSGKDIMTLPSGVKFQSMSLSAKDSLLLDNKQYSLSDLARFMGVSLSKLGISLGSNYQAAQQDQLNFYIDTLNPILKKIENAFNSKLIPDSVSNRYKIEFDRTSLAYFNDIMKNYKTQIEMGILSVNDVRKIFNQAEVDGGDEILVSTNLQSIQNYKVTVDTISDKPIENESIENQDITP
ncbi:phage portal protein [uncultured Bacteroides sp.]|jgi:HK97 family phage portal protein|uniref:phage portal protein n=1 Tax=uncultured Bacteroides sp. TaxID=162156 RepID=UPI0008202A24|nr:phage portal protein [uncultured Bacteroides sp.]SCH15616.1 phage portal protein%2C HK97 family [uncultured Bacteroides sp.]